MADDCRSRRAQGDGGVRGRPMARRGRLVCAQPRRGVSSKDVPDGVHNETDQALLAWQGPDTRRKHEAVKHSSDRRRLQDKNRLFYKKIHVCVEFKEMPKNLSLLI